MAQDDPFAAPLQKSSPPAKGRRKRYGLGATASSLVAPQGSPNFTLGEKHWEKSLPTSAGEDFLDLSDPALDVAGSTARAQRLEQVKRGRAAGLDHPHAAGQAELAKRRDKKAQGSTSNQRLQDYAANHAEQAVNQVARAAANSVVG